MRWRYTCPPTLAEERATRELSALWRVMMRGKGSAAPWQEYRRQRAAIWRRNGLTWRHFHNLMGMIGRKRRCRFARKQVVHV